MEIHDILGSACEYRVDYMRHVVLKGCKCEPESGHYAGQGEQMPFKRLKI